MNIWKNFIVLEGIDGAGTTTQLHLLEAQLKKENISFYTTAEPTDFITGKLIREILRGGQSIEPDTMAYLFAADRSEHLFNKIHGIKAQLDAGKIVICDRYLFSSLAYQSIECGFNFVYNLNKDFPLPHQLFFLDIPVNIGQDRLSTRSVKEIYEVSKFQHKVSAGYYKTLDFFSGSPMIIDKIDGTLPPEIIFEKISKNLKRPKPIIEV